MLTAPSSRHVGECTLRARCTGPTRASQPAPRLRHARTLDEPGLALALPFRSVELVATGGTSLIFRVADPRLRRPTAVKALRPNMGVHADLVAGIGAEYEVSQRVSHASIVRIHEVGDVDALPYLVMDWIDGVTLSEYANDGALAPCCVASIGAIVADALAAAHDAGVVHGDVKPDNILVPLASADGEPRATLIDFGVARIAGRATLRTAVRGTPRYMAPEQWGGIAVPSSDIYSLGCVLYELVTGRAPFGGRVGHVKYAHLHRTPTPPGQLRADVPIALESLVLNMLAKDWTARPPSMTKVADQLRELARAG